MKNGFVKTANYENVRNAIEQLKKRAAPERNIVLISGDPGLGKTSAIDRIASDGDAIYLRASSVETPVSQMRALADTDGKIGSRGSARTLQDNIVRYMLRYRIGLLVVDECQHLIRDRVDMLEALRDISDRTECPLVLVAGESGVEKKLARHPQIASRVAAAIEFAAATESDVSQAVRQLSDYKYDDQLIRVLTMRTAGKMRLILESINRLDQFAKSNSLQMVTLQDVNSHLSQLICSEWQAARRVA